eukprot:CAMPEP_0118694908 /NCGR_PEP_ID=MMETSP0800-20121206/12837_1 /TAXON_ID=210618 ORGANISM="Striatella unipunctata, Strain CCMP2910" /NCGR_SAMPLE_ID=MMETSP0800 /ASSEMBLY_ACC=CAM_ASM_000638 /LENGTH=165 /DNA_ID=CAMNT_0006593531 /DNA_START=544 /DNA_END=1041 /DNA_ORIENTATION=+
MELDYNPVFLNFESFPPDPNRGILLPPSTALFTSTNHQVFLFSTCPLLMPPVPDMSMPFNVISLTSTFFAFLVGSTINIIVRKANERLKRKYDQATGKEEKKKKSSLKDLIRNSMGKFLSKFTSMKGHPKETDVSSCATISASVPSDPGQNDIQTIDDQPTDSDS